MSVITTLKERIKSFEDASDLKLLRKLPVITVLNGRSFKKATSLLQKPFAPEFVEIMCATMVKLAQEIDGSTFLYSFNDEIVVVSRNDQNHETTPWYDNRVQKISSAAASIATLEFNKMAKAANVSLIGDPIFIGNTFAVPNITEAINVLVSKQQQAFQTSLHMACFHELTKKYHPDNVRQTLSEKNLQEKAELLRGECNIDFNKYPLPFKRGIATYRAPKVIPTDHGDEVKNKLTVDTEIPIFTKDHSFLSIIFKSGRDIFRAQRDV